MKRQSPIIGFDDYCFDNNHLNAGDEENTVRDPFSKRLA